MYGRTWTKQEDDFLRNNYRVGNAFVMADKLGRSYSSIRNRVYVLGLCGLSVNHNYFSDFENEGMPWVLGFWMADGCVTDGTKRTPMIGFTQKEKEVIDKIKTLIKSNHKTSLIKGRDCWSVLFTSKQMHSDLCSIFGMNVSRKSKTIQWPNIQDKYIKDFLRGCIDGDGCVFSKRKNIPGISFCSGSKTFLFDSTKHIERLTGIRITARKIQFAYEWRCSGVKAQCLSYWLYNNCDHTIKRKFDIVKEFWLWKPHHILSNLLTEKMCIMFPQFIPKEVYRRVVNG